VAGKASHGRGPQPFRLTHNGQISAINNIMNKFVVAPLAGYRADAQVPTAGLQACSADDRLIRHRSPS
jgi:hypothetical protein